MKADKGAIKRRSFQEADTSSAGLVRGKIGAEDEVEGGNIEEERERERRRSGRD